MAFFNNNGVKLFYETIGEGPPLLLINGLSCDTRQWEPLISFLKTSFQVISYDMRCSGHSDKPTDPITIPELADEALALMKYLKHDKVDVMGFSMGGIIAQDLALRHPEAIKKLALLSSMPSFRRPNPPSDDAMEILHAEEFSIELLEKIFNLIFATKYKTEANKKEYIKMKLEDKNPQPPEAYFNQLQASEKYESFDTVHNISLPTLIMTGDQDALISPKNSDWLNEKIPNSQLHIFKEVGHISPLECPEALANQLKQFFV